MRVEQGFQPVAFVEDHPYDSDPVLPSLLKRLVPQSILQEIEPDLVRLGQDVLTTVRHLASRASPPTLVQYNQWGERVDDLQTSEAWRDLKELAQREGIPGIFYERKHGEYSRVYGFMKILLLVADSHDIFCPMSMTDGSARVLELFGNPASKQDVLPRLISRDPLYAFTSGQWMTERPGGSDVSQTETKATATGVSSALGPEYKLDGFKWFSSATDSNISIALARTGDPALGSRSLSLFLVPLRAPLFPDPAQPAPNAVSNGILVHRLKNKIGTHPLPTAELSLNNTTAYLIGTPNQGVKNITPVLNITRVYSAVSSVSYLRKCMAISSAYANVRTVNGGKQLLRDTPLHISQLANISLTYRALTHLIFGVIHLLGKTENGTASKEEEGRLRILTPIVKAFAAEKCCAAMEDAMTTLGGQGYMEENGFGRAIRDALVEKIWEGTTTVLALDLVRAARDQQTMDYFHTWARNTISSSTALELELKAALALVKLGLDELSTAYQAPIPTLLPRPALILFGYIAASLYLLEHTVWSDSNKEPGNETDKEVFKRWALESGMVGAIEDVKRARAAGRERVAMDLDIVYGKEVKTRL